MTQIIKFTEPLLQIIQRNNQPTLIVQYLVQRHCLTRS